MYKFNWNIALGINDSSHEVIDIIGQNAKAI